MIWIALMCALTAFALFGLSMDDHHQRRFGTRPAPSRKRRMRSAAWGLLIIALPLAAGSHGWIFGPVLWFGLIMLAAGAVFLFLNFIAPPTKTGSARRKA